MKRAVPLSLQTKRKKTPSPAVPSSHRWHGALEGMHNGMLYGWALDTECPATRAVLEIRLEDDTLACVVADVARTDLAEYFQTACVSAHALDSCHGFVADLAQYTNHDTGGRLTVRIANTDITLPGQVDHQHPLKPSFSVSSSVFSDGGLRLHGWALDPTHRDRILQVKAFIGHEQVATAQADLLVPTLRSLDIGKYGFRLNLPPVWADGHVHSVRVVDQDGKPLNGSPVTVCCHVQGLKHLIPQSADNKVAVLLDNVIDVYEKHLPRSLSIAHYKDWSERFEAGCERPILPAAVSALRIAILITGDGDANAINRTKVSLKAQDATLQIFAGQPFSDLVQQALQSPCELLACVRAGDTLAPHALIHALEGFTAPSAKLVYTDSEQAGQPWFKPAWNPDYALSSDYPLELMLFHRSVLPPEMASRPPQDPAVLAWGVLAELWPQGASAIVHVPHVLYRFHTQLSSAEIVAREAAAMHTLEVVEPRAELSALPLPMPTSMSSARRLRRPLTARERGKSVSLIIPTRDRAELLERCISTIQQHTSWAKLEIIVVDNDSKLAQTKTYFRKIAKQGVRILSMPGPFNYADLNNRAVAAAGGEIIGLINNDIEALHSGWLDEIVGQLLRPGVGVVGAKLLWPNGMVQHGGVLLGIGNVAGHYGNCLTDTDWGDHGRNQLVQQVSAVTAACLFLRKKDYLAVGGMDSQAFPVAFNDVDLCLKFRSAGKAIVWTPYARLLHAESASRGNEDTPQKRSRSRREIDQLRQRWGEVLLRDPAYHPSLNLDLHSQAYGGLALPPRPRGPRLGALEVDSPAKASTIIGK